MTMGEKSKFSIGAGGRIINPEFEQAKETIHTAHRKAKKRVFRENVMSITGKASGVVISTAVGVLGVVIKEPWVIGLGVVALASSIALLKEKKGAEHQLLETDATVFNSAENLMKTVENKNLLPEVPDVIKDHLKSKRYYGDKSPKPS